MATLSNSEFHVQTLISKLQLTDDFVQRIGNQDDVWMVFGKKDSHLLRAKLFRLFNDAGLDAETKLMIFTLFAAIKNVKRVLEHIANLPSNIRSLKSLDKAEAFIKNSMVQYVSQESNSKFAAVHLPTTTPGLDIMLVAIMYEKDDNILNNIIIGRQTFAQIHINSELQTQNKILQKRFWDVTMGKSKNEDSELKGKKAGFVEEFYETSAKDDYLLITYDMKQLDPIDKSTGYTIEEVKKWYNDLKDKQAEKMKGDNKKAASPTITASSTKAITSGKK